MAEGSILGELLPNFDSTRIIDIVFNVLKGAGIAILVASVAFLFFYFRWKSKSKSKNPDIEIHWWEEVQGRMIPMRMDKAEEISVPGTNLKMFYIKASNTWLPRFTKGIAPRVFFVGVSENKEIINFTLQSLSSSMREARLSYDHTDMRWAAENMRDFVKRNYKDKATPWWREYKDIITTAIFILLMTFSLIIIIYFMRGIVQDMSALQGSINNAINQLQMCLPQGSGVSAA